MGDSILQNVIEPDGYVHVRDRRSKLEEKSRPGKSRRLGWNENACVRACVRQTDILKPTVQCPSRQTNPHEWP